VIKSAAGGPNVTWRLPDELLALLAEEEEDDSELDGPEDSDDLWEEFNV
jgi:hypothetical protein